MDFEPFHSSDDEEDANFLKKKETSEKKKKKIKLDKKEKLSFPELNSPMGIKPKQIVHGVVGPADYLEDQSPPAREPVLTTPRKNSNPPSTLNINPIHSAPNMQWTTPQKPYQSPFPKAMQHTPTQGAVPMFHPHHNLPNVTMPTKIERPHSSASTFINQERQSPNSPTPFKQSYHAATPNKVTLLERAKASPQFQSNPSSLNTQQQHQQHLQGGQLQHPQVIAAAGINVNHQRNQSYSRAMSVPILSTEHPSNTQNQFQYQFENSETHNLQNSPIREVASPLPAEKMSSPLHSPIPMNRPSLTEVPNEVPNQIPTIAQDLPNEDWAHFSVTSSPQGSLSDRQDYNPYTSQDGVSSLSESTHHGSTSSLESDLDENVWKINDEQKEYYTNQFQKIQPNINEIIKGQQAREFFLKSNLPTELLSKIWRLSDLDNDHALNLEEFCIAMHLVVAVRHGVELPQELPYTLLHHNDISLDQMEGDEVFPQHNVSDEQANDLNQSTNIWAANFEGNKDNIENVPSMKDAIQTSGQATATSTSSIEYRIHPVSSEKEEQNIISEKQISSSTEILNTPEKFLENSTQVRHSSVSSESAIARPRAQPNKNVNLMDASPWQLLPPPSSKTKPKVKKSLTLDGIISPRNYARRLENDDNNDDDDIDDIDNDESMLVSIDRSHDNELGVSELKDFDDNIERLHVKKKLSQGKLSKEKSRSIDSLRSDISESSEFHWRRSSKIENRQRSFTGESVSDQSIQDKEFEIAPTPPPRVPKSHHVRSSSLDWNHLFSTNNKTSQSLSDLPNARSNNSTPLQTKPQKPPRTNLPKSAKADSRPRPFSATGILTNQRRAFSDIALQKHNEDIVTDNTHRNSVPSNEYSGSKEGLVRFSDQLHYMPNKSKSPIEIQMRKNEIQERIERLKSKNQALLQLGDELHHQYKNVCQERIELSSKIKDLENRMHNI